MECLILAFNTYVRVLRLFDSLNENRRFGLTLPSRSPCVLISSPLKRKSFGISNFVFDLFFGFD